MSLPPCALSGVLLPIIPCSVLTWADEMMRDEETSKYVDGMAFHWYFGGWNRALDGGMGWGCLNMSACYA